MKFKPEDFDDVHCEECAFIAAKIANTKLQEWLDTAETFYAVNPPEAAKVWAREGSHVLKAQKALYKCKIVCIEEIKDKP